MLKKILSGKTCAECRLCCIFDRYDVWETPAFTEELCDKIRSVRPGTEFVTKDGGYIFKVGELKGDEIFAYADRHPEIVKPYYEGYPVLMFERKPL